MWHGSFKSAIMVGQAILVATVATDVHLFWAALVVVSLAEWLLELVLGIIRVVKSIF